MADKNVQLTSGDDKIYPEPACFAPGDSYPTSDGSNSVFLFTWLDYRSIKKYYL